MKQSFFSICMMEHETTIRLALAVTQNFVPSNVLGRAPTQQAEHNLKTRQKFS